MQGLHVCNSQNSQVWLLSNGVISLFYLLVSVCAFTINTEQYQECLSLSPAFLWSIPIAITTKLHTNILKEGKEIPFTRKCSMLSALNQAWLLLPCQNSVLQKENRLSSPHKKKLLSKIPLDMTILNLTKAYSLVSAGRKKTKCSYSYKKRAHQMPLLSTMSQCLQRPQIPISAPHHYHPMSNTSILHVPLSNSFKWQKSILYSLIPFLWEYRQTHFTFQIN